MNGPAKTMIEARDLTVGYGDRPVLEGINLLFSKSPNPVRELAQPPRK